MRILIIAPHPYYSERGTPIAVELLVRALKERGDDVDILTYHEGEDRPSSGVQIHRIKPWTPIRDVAPGPSWKKLVCDFFLASKAAALLKRGQYDLVHALEEGAILAGFLCRKSRIPFVYDMDSSMATQIEDKYPLARPLAFVFFKLQGWAVRRAHAVIPMCEALVEEYEQFNPGRFFILHDVSLRQEETPEIRDAAARVDFNCDADALKFMYVGNLEYYQGIDLLLDAFALAARRISTKIHLVIVGGRSEDIEKYVAKCRDLGISDEVSFCGPRPVSEIGVLMERADALVSPRIQGVNTPMKVYSYIDSGRALLATRLRTHTQVLDDSLACLVDADSESMADGIVQLASSSEYRQRIAAAAKKRAEQRHTYAAFREDVFSYYSKFERELAHVPSVPPVDTRL